MNLVEHYIKLRSAYPPGKGEMAVTVAELAETLCCTRRNVKHLIRKMEERKWIRWMPGNGRGNRSVLIFQRGLEEMAVSHFTDLLEKGRVHDAMEFLRREELPEEVWEQCRKRLHVRLGLQVEQADNRRREVLKIPLYRKLTTLDPSAVSVVAECHFVRQVYDTLVHYDAETRLLRPHLAHAWESDSAHAEWTFYLRKGVRFHDGRLLSAEDVRHTFLRLMEAPNSVMPWLARYIAEIEVMDEHAIRFRLTDSLPFFPRFLGTVNTSIRPRESARRHVGTGPFQIRELSDSRVVFEAFDGYFRERPLLDRIELWLVPGEKKGEARYQLPGEDESGGEREVLFEQFACEMLVFNFRRPGPQHDIRFRRAMRAICDRRRMVKDLGGNERFPADSMLPEKSRLAEVSPSSLDEARSWLEGSRYAGETLSLYYFDQSEGNCGTKAEVADWIRKRAQAVGVRISPVPVPIDWLYRKELEEKADLFLMADVFDSDFESSWFMFFRNVNLFRRFLDPDRLNAVDRRTDRFVRESSAEDRRRIIDEVEEFLHRDLMMLFLCHLYKRIKYPRNLQGMTFDSFGWADFRKLWIRPCGGRSDAASSG
ncbi:MAG: ABC transporter substrate-binding protein [Planifilum fimeticola]